MHLKKKLYPEAENLVNTTSIMRALSYSKTFTYVWKIISNVFYIYFFWVR